MGMKWARYLDGEGGGGEAALVLVSQSGLELGAEPGGEPGQQLRGVAVPRHHVHQVVAEVVGQVAHQGPLHVGQGGRLQYSYIVR